ncbi:MAG: hypothetical protein RPG89_05980 [Microcystis panniformis WG22]|nr:hypothetical protein [Microcystis panniformis WG22]
MATKSHYLVQWVADFQNDLVYLLTELQARWPKYQKLLSCFESKLHIRFFLLPPADRLISTSNLNYEQLTRLSPDKQEGYGTTNELLPPATD